MTKAASLLKQMISCVQRRMMLSYLVEQKVRVLSDQLRKERWR